MLSIAYVSTVTRELLEEGFVDLLHFIREKNRSLEISGMLLYCEEGLMQVIEGSDDVVRPLYAAIQSDPRHTQVTTVWEESSTERWFGESAMGMRRVMPRELKEVSGWTDLRQAVDGDQPSNRDTAFHLLTTFHRTTMN